MKHVLGHQRSKRSHCSLPKMCIASWNLLNIIKIELSKIQGGFSDETKINQFQSNGHTWCWVKDGESQFQAHHVGRTDKHEGGAIFVWNCMTSHGTGYMCKIEEKMTQVLYLSILQDGVTKTIEWYCFNLSHVIFQHDNDPKNIAILVKGSSMQNFEVLGLLNHLPKFIRACVGTCETEIK